MLESHAAELTRRMCLFLADRALKMPDGRPLYAYRCQEDELNQLRTDLRLIAPHLYGASHSSVGHAFCLFASEWWRREHEGGSWAWEPILEELRFQHLHWKYQLYPMIQQGLQLWKRPLLRRGSGHRLFLVTLACEGGLPLKMVRKDGAHLQLYFRAVLEDYGVFQAGGDDAASLAARRARILPRSLRQDVVYELAGRLVESIWELQGRVSETQHPVAELDRVDQNWRDSLPLEIADETARALLNNLVAEAQQVRLKASSRFRARRWLERTQAGWRLKAGIQIGSSLEVGDVADLFSLGEIPLPPRFGLEVEARSSGVSELLGIGTLVRGRDSEPRVRLEVQDVSFEDCAAAEGLRIWLLEGTRRMAQARPRHGEPLGDLPWVFIDSDQEPLFRGTSPIRLRQEKCWIAVPDESPLPDSLSDDTPTELIAFDRRIVRARESLQLDVDDATCTITLGVGTPGRRETLLLDGRKLPASEREVFLGVPSVRLVDDSGREDARRSSQLETEWRPSGSRGPWRLVDPSCVGKIQFRVVSPDGPIFQDRLRMLPASARIDLEPHSFTSGAVKMRNIEARVWLLQPPEVESRDHIRADGVRLELEARTPEAPSSIVLRFDWGEDRRLDLSLPFPSQGCRFIGLEGKILGDKDIIPLAKMTHFHATVTTPNTLTPIDLHALLNAKDLEQDIPVELSFPITAETIQRRLPLRNVQDQLSRLFSTTEDLDAFIRLRFDTPLDVRPRPLIVSRFELLLEPDREACLVRATTSAGEAPADTDSLEVEAYRFWDPNCEPLELVRINGTEWSFPVASINPGPWLIVGREAGWCRTRPLRWTTPDETGRPADDELGSELQRAVCLLDPEERQERLQEAIEIMSQDSNDPSWAALEGYVKWLEILPPSSLDLTIQLAQHPTVLALAIVRSTAEMLDRIWDAMEQLPFEWFQIPAQAWSNAARIHLESTQRVLSEVGVEGDFDKESFLRGFLREGPGPSHRWFLRPITDWVRIKEIGDVQGGQALFEDGQRGKALLDELGQEFQKAIHRNEGRQWPPGSAALASWFRSLPHHTALSEWQMLARIPDQHPSHRKPIFLAPLAAALACAETIPSGRKVLFSLRRIRSFDRVWFDVALEMGLRLFLGRMILQAAQEQQ